MSALSTGAATGARDVRHTGSLRSLAASGRTLRGDWHVWLSWVGSSMIGVVLGALLVSATQASRGGFALTLLAGVGGALIVGAMQGFVLRRYCPALSMPSWLGATIAGHVAASIAAIAMLIPGVLRALGTVGSLAGPSAVAFITTAVIGAAAGAASGSVPWLVLRKHFPRAGVWVLATALAGAIAALTPVPRLGGTINGIPLAPIAARVATALIVASVTGVALAWLVRRGRGASGAARVTQDRDSPVAGRPDAQ